MKDRDVKHEDRQNYNGLLFSAIRQQEGGAIV